MIECNRLHWEVWMSEDTRDIINDIADWLYIEPGELSDRDVLRLIRARVSDLEDHGGYFILNLDMERVWTGFKEGGGVTSKLLPKCMCPDDWENCEACGNKEEGNG